MLLSADADGTGPLRLRAVHQHKDLNLDYEQSFDPFGQ